MKIDLHCHTKKIKTGDALTRNVDTKKFCEKVCQADVGIVAITNHNHFDIEQYKEFQIAIGENCSIWPGIELDIQGGKNRGHMIVIANPDNADSFSKKINELIANQNVDQFIIDLKTVYGTLNSCDVIYIPHFHKEPKLSEQDIKELDEMLADKSRLFKETSDYRSLGVFSNFDYSMMIGSDVQDWDYYENSKFADIRLPIKTFKQFCLLAKKDKQVINTLLNSKHKSLITVKPHKNVNISVPIYEDVNIIFGQKGTGKSEILKSLKSYYEEKSILYKSYVGNDKESDYGKILSLDDMKRDVDKISVGVYSEEFNQIYEWQDCKPVALKNYIEWLDTKDNNKNKSDMKITDAVILDNETSDRKLDKDYKNIDDFLKSTFLKIQFEKYFSEQKINELLNLIGELVEKISEDKLENWKRINSIKLTNYSIDKIKQIADKCSESVSKPSTTGFTEFALNRLELSAAAHRINQSFEAKEVVEKEYLGEIEGKGSIYVAKRYRLHCDISKTAEFSKGIKKLSAIKNIIKNIEKSFEKKELSSEITDFREHYEVDGVKDLSHFVGISKLTVLEDDSEYIPSSGEKGILLLQKMLDTDSDVYILDEPELGMGNSYINASILPKIIKLAKSRKTVIVATHNANVAVRTLPYVSIFRCHENGKYMTYVGNPFSDELSNIEDELDVRNWTEESMHTLEGGKEAFYERKDIYESGRKDH